MIDKLLKHKSERMFIEQNKDIHIFNYWFYRYVSNRYLNWLRERAIMFEEAKEND